MARTRVTITGYLEAMSGQAELNEYENDFYSAGHLAQAAMGLEKKAQG